MELKFLALADAPGCSSSHPKPSDLAVGGGAEPAPEFNVSNPVSTRQHKVPSTEQHHQEKQEMENPNEGGPEIRREGPMKCFYFVVLTGCELGESSQRAQKTSASSIFLSETPARLPEPSRLNRDLLILGFCCNPNHNSLISCYHVCEPTCPRCSGCQKSPQTNSSWEWWPIPSAASLPFTGKASRSSRAPGCLSRPRALVQY